MYESAGRISESGGSVVKCPIYQHCEKLVTYRKNDRRNQFEKRWGGLNELNEGKKERHH